MSTNEPMAPSKYEKNSPRIAPNLAKAKPLTTTADISAAYDAIVLTSISPSTFFIFKFIV